MEQNRNIALFDMDGTICDYAGQIHHELAKLRAPNEPFIDPFKLGKDDRSHQYLWNRMQLIKSDENWWANLPKLSLGFDVMRAAKDLGYDCEILTQAPKTNPAALSGKLKWLLENVDPDTDFTMTRNKSRHYGRVLVDDFPEFVVPWLKNRPRGLVIMPSNEYNRGFKHDRVILYDGINIEEVRKGLERTLIKEKS